MEKWLQINFFRVLNHNIHQHKDPSANLENIDDPLKITSQFSRISKTADWEFFFFFQNHSKQRYWEENFKPDWHKSICIIISLLRYQENNRIVKISFLYENDRFNSSVYKGSWSGKDKDQPVSILPNLSKAFEKYFYRRAAKPNIPSQHHCGLRKDHSYLHCLLTHWKKGRLWGKVLGLY